MDEQDIYLGSPQVTPYMFITTGLIITTENAYLIYVIFKNFSLHTTNYYFIASLGLSDLLVGVIALVSGIIRLPFVTTPYYLISLALTVAISLIILSCVQMAIIAVDRWLYISRPFLYVRCFTTKRVKKIIAFLWLLDVIYVCVLLTIQVQVFNSWPQNTFSFHAVLKSVGIFAIYIIASIVACVSYVFILIIARKKKQTTVEPGEAEPRGGHKFKEVTFFLVVFGLYFAMSCCSMFALQIDVFVHVPPLFFSISSHVSFMNSCLNFCILLLRDRNFRKACLKTINCRRVGQTSTEQTNSVSTNVNHKTTTSVIE